jgi:TatA/E family protein of Tat protein translocase
VRAGNNGDDGGRCLETLYLGLGGSVVGSLGLPEIILIFVVALLLFGPRRMPQIGRSIGRALGEFRRASNEFKRTIEDEVAAEEVRDVERELRKVRSVGAEVVGAAVEDTPAQGNDASEVS